MVDIMRLSVADQRDEIIFGEFFNKKKYGCLLYTSDAADER